MTRDEAAEIVANNVDERVRELYGLGQCHDGDYLTEAWEVLSENDATKNEAASAEEVGPPTGTAWGCEAGDLAFVGIFHPIEPGFVAVRPMHADEMEALRKMAVQCLDTMTGIEVIVRPTSFEELANKRGEERAASEVSQPAKATTEEDPVTDKAEGKCSHCDWGQFSRPCKQCPNPNEFHRYRKEQITASRNKKATQ